MGKGNLQKTQQKRERNAKKDNGDNAHSILKTKEKAMTIQYVTFFLFSSFEFSIINFFRCKICMTGFLGKFQVFK